MYLYYTLESSCRVHNSAREEEAYPKIWDVFPECDLDLSQNVITSSFGQALPI